MSYIVNTQAYETPEWINTGDTFLRSKYGAAIYIIALIIVVLLYSFGNDFSGLQTKIMGIFSSNSSTPTYATTTSTNNKLSKGSTIIAVIGGLLVLCGIILYYLRVVEYNKTQVISLVDNITDGKTMKLLDTINLPPSTNRATGAEFAYGTWLRINDWTYNAATPKYLLVKGRIANNNTIVTQSPSIQLTTTNTLRITTQTFGSGLSNPLLTESVELHSIPLRKWFHLLVAVSGRNIDIYINGTLAKRSKLGGLVALNNDPLYLCPSINNGNNYSLAGFGGLIYKMNYYAYYPSQSEIAAMLADRPSEDDDAPACEKK